MKLELINEWRQCWKWISVNCMVCAGVIQGTWAEIPDDMKQYIPHGLVTGFTIGLLIFGIIGRLIKQGGNNA